MRTATFLAILLTLGVGRTAPVSAADRFPPDTGRRVRVTAPSQFLDGDTGTVLSHDPDGMAIQLEESGERVELPYGDIAWLEVSRGRSHATLLGAAGGALLGGLLGTLATPMPEANLDEPPSSGGGGGFFLGAILGGFVGGLIGSTVEFEHWDPVFTAWPYWGAKDEQGAAGLLVSVSF